MKEYIRKPAVRQRIKDEIIGMISSERMLPGDKIMPQNELAQRFKTTPVTIHKALRELVDEGVVERRKGVGTFISARKVMEFPRDKQICLVLHRTGLDRPQFNPEYWPYMQDLIFDFSAMLSKGYSFTMKYADPETNVGRLIEDLKGYFAVFFHYSNEVPISIIKTVIRSRVAPVVKIGKTQERLDCIQLDNDRFTDLQTAANYLISLGHRRIGYLGSSHWWGDLGLAGFRSALEMAGLPECPEFVFRFDVEREAGCKLADRIAEGGDFPDAIVADSDLRGLGLVEQLRIRNIRVPEDISVVSHDGLQLAAYHPPYLSTIKIPYGKMIQEALELIERSNDRTTIIHTIVMDGELIEGRTVKPKKATS
jgi:DNA-binding LacI/PurR family transcriptional regulator/DNA-binding transcriptional regulator YhcF (GntR family)